MAFILTQPDPRAAFFDERAAGWEDRCYPEKARERVAALVREFGVKGGDTILDMGAGTGILAPYLRRHCGPTGVIVSMDISLEMIRHAASKPDYTPGLALQASAMHLPFQENSFDCIICFAAFPHFSDKAVALSEMHRVLRPGGRLCIAHLFSREELARHHGGHPAVAEDTLPEQSDLLRLFAGAGFPVPGLVDIPGRFLATATKE